MGKIDSEIIMNFMCETIGLYKKLVFENKEFIISKRILKLITEVGSTFSTNKTQEVFENLVEIEFWLKILEMVIHQYNEHNNSLDKVQQLIQQVQTIVSKMEENI